MDAPRGIRVRTKRNAYLLDIKEIIYVTAGICYVLR
jgi:hypothetical protein